jgi:hypothetical protein
MTTDLVFLVPTFWGWSNPDERSGGSRLALVKGGLGLAIVSQS